MPELPEVETIAKRLRNLLPGKKIKSVQVLKDKSFGGDRLLVTNQTITDISRRAKLIRLHLTNGLNLLTHLKMTGQLIYIDDDQRVGGGHPTADWVNELPSKHTRIIYDLTDQSRLFFNDQRIFGWMKVMTSDQVAAEYAQLGPDINDPALTWQTLFTALQRRSVPIKQALMDNKIVCGVGNIYASDALNLAQISPLRPAKSLTATEAQRLFEQTQLVIARGIELGGTTFDGKYVDVDGFAGHYQHELIAYGREGEPCRNCSTPLTKLTVGGRGTYYCQQCQR